MRRRTWVEGDGTVGNSQNHAYVSFNKSCLMEVGTPQKTKMINVPDVIISS